MRHIFTMTLLAALSAGGGALAQSPAAAAATEPTASAPALSADELAEASGGQGVTVDVMSRQQLTGSTSGNTVNAGTLTSGEVSFGPNALDGFNGVGNFVINTGANNTLQGAINITIVTTPLP